ncbi:MAG: selenite/tellurite reduction operon b-type cytochrome membrane protein ExtQ [Thermodesulfobacteriota bacterium]|nr:selenite/tellurite reduction operon b-type cytochrome membrane protein ExtQ [Thermodesulfobacteriota bacterium]
MKGYVRSSPFFFRRIVISIGLLIAALVILAVLIPAPLQGPADMANVPNPIKSAWFLLWTQELVSYSKHLVYPIVFLGFYFLLLPYLPGSAECKQARWLQKDQWLISVLTLMIFAAIVVLTVVAVFMRGENWVFVFNS